MYGTIKNSRDDKGCGRRIRKISAAVLLSAHCREVNLRTSNCPAKNDLQGRYAERQDTDALNFIPFPCFLLHLLLEAKRPRGFILFCFCTNSVFVFVIVPNEVEEKTRGDTSYAIAGGEDDEEPEAVWGCVDVVSGGAGGADVTSASRECVSVWWSLNLTSSSRGRFATTRNQSRNESQSIACRTSVW
jgi:hypothetical protein